MENTQTHSRASRAAVRNGVGVGVGVGTSGLAFGAAASAAGLSVAQACVLSLAAFTGASQFALLGVVGAGGSLVAGASSAVLLGGRNALYGLRLSRLFGRGPRRLLAAHGVIDETTAVALGQPDPEASRTGFVATFATLYLVWNLSTLAGAFGAQWVSDPAAFGLDVVGPAAFLGLLWPRLAEGAAQRRVALAAVVVAVATTPFLPPGLPIMVAVVAVLAGVRR